jgi:NAD(P)-dependent dehydrogenase (short-subunit alcohol dehydrogenase family)
VNCVAPGAIATDFSGGVVRDNPQVAQAVANMTALGRPGVPEDIGR